MLKQEDRTQTVAKGWGWPTTVAIESLDEHGLADLSQRVDELGVLSVYLNADPRQDTNLQAAAIDLRNRFRELKRRLAEEAGADRGRDVAAALTRLWPRIENLTSPIASGRGRVAFAGLDGDWILRLDSAMPVPTRVVLDDGPFIHPLLEALDEGRAAGVVLVSTEEARLLEWRMGTLQTLSRLQRQYVQAPHERAGQIGGGPQGQFHTPMREQRQAREHQWVQRFLDQVTEVAVELAGDRGWERILVSGGERWTQPTVAKFPDALRNKVFADARVLTGLDDAALASAVTEWVHVQDADRESQIVARVREAAASRNAALGLSEVTAALNAGRVAHLVYDPKVRYMGTVGANGALYGDGEVGPHAHPSRTEPRLTERMVERALETGARISPVEGAADGELTDAAGVAAVLRW